MAVTYAALWDFVWWGVVPGGEAILRGASRAGQIGRAYV